MEKKEDGIKKYFHLYSYYSLLKTCDIRKIIKQKRPMRYVLQLTFSIAFSIALQALILNAYMLTVSQNGVFYL
jgi:C1A family cysteine protease